MVSSWVCPTTTNFPKYSWNKPKHKPLFLVWSLRKKKCRIREELKFQNVRNFVHVGTSLTGGSGVWFHNWTDLSQSDFFPDLSLFLSLLSLGWWDCCSSSSSDVFFIGINSSNTGPSLEVCSEHSDCPWKYSWVVPDICCLHDSIAANPRHTSTQHLKI